MGIQEVDVMTALLLLSPLILIILAVVFTFQMCRWINDESQKNTNHFNDWIDGHEKRMGNALTGKQKAHLDELRQRWPRKEIKRRK